VQVDAPRLEDRLGPHEPPYQSRGEAQVGRLLDRYGIPFFYEKPLVTADASGRKCWYPDFTLPTYGNLVVEYAGMPDRPEYMARLQRKEAAYAASHVPSLILYPIDLTGRDWPARVIQRIEQAYPKSLSSMRYPARSAFAPPAGPRCSYSRRCGYRR
jgi:hypothetical protein